ncbi:hypothetical protein CB1_000707009 [Camelus ferus]|nr:hypothetical protein CB1_000707009 [Camelus ferus]
MCRKTCQYHDHSVTLKDGRKSLQVLVLAARAAGGRSPGEWWYLEQQNWQADCCYLASVTLYLKAIKTQQRQLRKCMLDPECHGGKPSPPSRREQELHGASRCCSPRSTACFRLTDPTCGKSKVCTCQHLRDAADLAHTDCLLTI